nr:YihY/virulence factor BrkB family protein [Lysobacter sp. M2-1]
MSGVPPPTRERQRAQRRERRLARLKGSLPVALARRFIELDILTHAASLAFYALLSLAPLLVLLLWLTASLYGSAQEAIVDQVGELAGREAASVADTVIANADQRPGIGSIAGLWSTLLLFVGATAVFARLQDALNLIFRTDAARLPGLRAWIRKRVLSFGVVLALGFLLLVATAVSTLLQLILAGMPSLLPVFGSLASLALYALSFALLYHFLPDRRVRWRQALFGGLITAGLFVLGRWAIGIYLASAAPGSAYGSMGAMVLLLVWMYYAAVVFFGGALITAVIDERARARRIAQANAAPPAAPSG